MTKLENSIDTLNLSSNLVNKLKEQNINLIKDVWVFTRKKLKELGLELNPSEE